MDGYVMAEKYVVFKREDMEIFRKYLADFEMPKELEGCVVIRLQDIFAESCLSSYANSVITAAEIAKNSSASVNSRIYENLMRIADYFFDEAAKARTWPTKKVPD